MRNNEETSIGTKIAQFSYRYFNPRAHFQIKLWQVWTRVAKQYNKT